MSCVSLRSMLSQGLPWSISMTIRAVYIRRLSFKNFFSVRKKLINRNRLNEPQVQSLGNNLSSVDTDFEVCSGVRWPIDLYRRSLRLLSQTAQLFFC
jgi:hypothetical protein